jgi:hypothetical protein
MNLVPIQITLQAANAADVKQLVHDLAGTMSGMPQSMIPSETSVSTVQPGTTPCSQRTTKKEESEVKAVETEAEEFLNSTQDSVEIPSVVDLRAKAQEVGKTAEGKKAVKALLNKYNSPSISDVPADGRTEFMAELEKLV